MLTANKAPSRAVKKIEKKENYLYLVSEYSTTRIAFKTPCIAAVTVSRGDFDTLEKPGVIKKDFCSEWDYCENADYVEIKSSEVILRVSKKDSSIGFYDLSGELLFEEAGKYPVEFEEYDTYLLTGEGSKTEVIQTPDGEKTVIREAVKQYNGKSNHITWHPVFKDEALYGLGQHEEGYGNLRGKTVYVHQANRKIAVPMIVSTKGYGILMDTYSPVIFNDSANEPYIYNESAHDWDYYFIKGYKENSDNICSAMDGVIAGYRELTGKASLLPKWAFGYVQSKERYEDETQILETVKKSRELGLGMDCIVLDWISWEDGKWGQKTFDKKRFGNAKEMIDSLHKDGVHFMISVWPTTDPSCDNNREFKEAGLLINASNLYNPFLKEGRDMYWKQLNEEHWPSGVDSWWCDSSEPITPEWSVRTRPEPSALFQEYCKELGLRVTDEMSNAFSLFHAQGIYEGQRGEMDKAKASNPDYKEKRVCNLTRSAYTGQQRMGTIMWSGDIAASWKTYKEQIGTGLNFCASGFPYWTVDVGAFFVKPGDFWYWDGDYEDPVNNPGYGELYTRWYQWAAFLPVFRCHGTDLDREMWVFGEDGNMFYDAMKKVNKLRYELIPYIYSEAGKTWHNDGSIMRNLSFEFSDDKNVWDITDQYMFGESIMVCPVVEPMYYDNDGREIHKSHTRKVYLPKGTCWFDFYTKEKYEGGRYIEVQADIDRIPLFVKNGSIIPTGEFALSTSEQREDIKYQVYSDKPCTYDLYQDAGDGYAYETGEYTLKTIKYDGEKITE
ncbi:MAG: glycoside hydrolase family 31 protein [Lachnospiraceae bacterium]|nr:glycoside hydrolase family 31 protein [Lachnospiraceae bacterium]